MISPQLSTLLLVTLPFVSAHTLMSKPLSRQGHCWGGNSWKYGGPGLTHPNCDNWDTAEYQTHAYRHPFPANDFEGLKREVLTGGFDGHLCSGLVRNQRDPVMPEVVLKNYDAPEFWTKDIVSINKYTNGQTIDLQIDVSAPHGGDVIFFMTHDNVYGGRALKIDDFEQIPNCKISNVTKPMMYDVQCTLPKRATDKHVILYAYQGGMGGNGFYGTTEVFTGCADIQLIDNDEGSTSQNPDPTGSEGEDGTVTVTATTIKTSHVTSTVTITSTLTDGATGLPEGPAEVCDRVACIGCVMAYKTSSMNVVQCLQGIIADECPTTYSGNGVQYHYCA